MGPFDMFTLYVGSWFAVAAEPDPDATPVETPGSEQLQSFVETLVQLVDNTLLRRLLRDVLAPSLQILLILVLATVVLFVARRLIRRAVARAKDPDAPRATRLRRKVGLADASAPSYSLRRAQRADALGALLGSIATVVVWVLASFLILAEIGINLAPLVAGAGVVGLAIGFGAQNLVADFLSGVFMLAEDQFGVGDEIDVGDEVVGVVEGVSLRTTRIRDVRGTLWHVPNGEIRRVGNSSQQWARSLLDIGISYDVDVDLAIDLIQRVAVEMSEEDGYREAFLSEPSVWGVQDLGPDSVDIRLVIKTEPGRQWAISREMRRRIKGAFDAAGIEMPFPQRTVWLRQDDDRPAPDTSSTGVEAAVAAAAEGDRGPEVTTRQDAIAVAEDVEADLAEEADAVPAEEAAPGDADPPDHAEGPGGHR